LRTPEVVTEYSTLSYNCGNPEASSLGHNFCMAEMSPQIITFGCIFIGAEIDNLRVYEIKAETTSFSNSI
jgi:hypothetical protein